MVPWETHTYRATFMAFLPTQKHDKELKGREGRDKMRPKWEILFLALDLPGTQDNKLVISG